MAARTWLDFKAKVFDYPVLTPEELFTIWQLNRNALTGTMAAEEIMKRIGRSELVLMEAQAQPPAQG